MWVSTANSCSICKWKSISWLLQIHLRPDSWSTSTWLTYTFWLVQPTNAFTSQQVQDSRAKLVQDTAVRWGRDWPFVLESFAAVDVAGGLADHGAEWAVADHHAVHQGHRQRRPGPDTAAVRRANIPTVYVRELGPVSWTSDSLADGLFGQCSIIPTFSYSLFEICMLLTELVKVQNLCTWVKVQVTQKKATQVEVKILQKNCTWSTSKK